MAKLNLVEKVGQTLTVADIDKLSGKEEVTSLEMVDMINAFRRMEGRKAELAHRTMLRTIRDELEMDINENKIVPIEYLDSRGRVQDAFSLTPNQCKRILLRESKMVRYWMVDYLERLEETNRLLEMRLREKAEWKFDMSMIDENAEGGVEKFKMANSAVNQRVAQIYGIKRKVSKATMTEEQLKTRESENRDIAILHKFHGASGLDIYKKTYNIK